MEKMDVNALTQLMETVTENLALVQKDKCSDEFLIVLDELIKKAVHVKSEANESPNKKRRLTDDSCSSDDVRCVSTEIETISVDSDSDAAEDAVEDNSNGFNISSTLSNQSTVTVHTENPSTQGLHITELYGKWPVVKLKRIDVTSYRSSAIHGLDRNVASPSANNGMPSERSGQRQRRNTCWHKNPNSPKRKNHK